MVHKYKRLKTKSQPNVRTTSGIQWHLLWLTLKEASASFTLFSMKSSVIRREGCSLKTEFIRAILAALRLASAFVGQNCPKVNENKHSQTHRWKDWWEWVLRSYRMKALRHTAHPLMLSLRKQHPFFFFFFFFLFFFKSHNWHADKIQTEYLETSEAAATWKAYIAHIWRAVRRDHFINNQSSVPQVGPSGLLHLPELL